MVCYLVMREEGQRTDGYYYESRTSILGAREKPEEAVELLHEMMEKYHPGEKPYNDIFNVYGDKMAEYSNGELGDKFWIEKIETVKGRNDFGI